MKAASKLSHIQTSGTNFDSRMSHAYMGLLKKSISEGVSNGICPDWFEVMDKEPGKKNIDGVSLVEFRAEESINLEPEDSLNEDVAHFLLLTELQSSKTLPMAD